MAIKREDKFRTHRLMQIDHRIRNGEFPSVEEFQNELEKKKQLVKYLDSDINLLKENSNIEESCRGVFDYRSYINTVNMFMNSIIKYIADYYIRAVVCHVENKTDGITVYPLSEYTEELAGQNAIRSQDENFSLE